MRRGAKRKTTHKAESPKKPPAEELINEPTESPSRQAEEQQSTGNAEPAPSNKAAAKGRRKRAKVSKPETEPEYFPEKRNLEDLWQQVFPVGTEDAFEEGGELYNKTVYLFGCTEPQLVYFQGQAKVTMIPVVVAVVSPFPPSDKIGIKSVQRETEEIVPMKQMKMAWVPYIPLEKRSKLVGPATLKISMEELATVPSCNANQSNFKEIVIQYSSSVEPYDNTKLRKQTQQKQWKAGLQHLKIERVKKFEYCLPYFYHPFQEDEIEQSTVVFCEFDWELDELEEFTDKLIEEEELSADQKEPFKDFVKEKVREAKKANREAREARRKALAEMSEETRAAFENMRFYKFYPVSSPDTPDVSNVKILWEGSPGFMSDMPRTQFTSDGREQLRLVIICLVGVGS
ncbi:hypothetical protein DH2020_015427 [Rehmannia glutinosa]|uniref:Protein HEAT INTOLERANT 4-like n=1 Tax=Rehmannia glutinosa TaxID=99300 RepID=A0ABR0WWT6_REHGL